MSRKRWAAPEMRRELRRLVFEGHGPTQVYQELDRLGLFADWKPSKKTIERMVRDELPPDETGDWSFADADPEDIDAAIVRDTRAHTAPFGVLFVEVEFCAAGRHLSSSA